MFNLNYKTMNEVQRAMLDKILEATKEYNKVMSLNRSTDYYLKKMKELHDKKEAIGKEIAKLHAWGNQKRKPFKQ